MEIINKLLTPIKGNTYEEITLYYNSVISSYCIQIQEVVKFEKTQTKVYKTKIRLKILEKVKNTPKNLLVFLNKLKTVYNVCNKLDLK